MFRVLGDKLLHNDNLLFTFLRSIASSQAASWVDMAVRFALFAWVNLNAFLSTACGCVVGGIVNCIINYRFTFHCKESSAAAVAVKYAMVWIGSLLLNSGGTTLLYHTLQRWTWLETIGFKPDGYYAAATLFVSLIVSWAWNFLLQRIFVYRHVWFDRHAEKLVHLIKRNATDAATDSDGGAEADAPTQKEHTTIEKSSEN